MNTDKILIGKKQPATQSLPMTIGRKTFIHFALTKMNGFTKYMKMGFF